MKQKQLVLEGAAAKKHIADLINNKKYAEAEPLLVDLLRRSPDAVIGLIGLGIVYRSTERYDAAEACYRRALDLSPGDGEICTNFGNLLTDMDKLDEALSCGRRAVKSDPESVLFRKNLAVTQRESKNFADALESYEWCCARTPNDPQLLLNVSLVSFYLRQIEKGWDHYEHRFATDRIRYPAFVNLKRWRGEDVKGKRLLVVAEQGFGDTILAARFIPVLVARGAEVTFCCNSALHKLFAKLPVVRLIDEGVIRERDFDFHVPVMSMPRGLEPDWLKWPAAPEFNIPEESRRKFADLAAHKGRLNVGIVWSGSITFGENAKRSVSLARFHQLAAQAPAARYFSFQKGEREADLASLGAGVMHALGHRFDDFSETAAALEHMDLIVMTDSSLAHLAGSLGVPVLNLLNYKPYWLYFPEVPTTPIYPSMRFIRQQTPGGWDDVFDRTAQLLRRLAREGKPSREKIFEIIDSELSPPKVPARKGNKPARRKR